ncbi:UPF0149 family protein [Vibrio sp. WXL103]|uniref:UPF0149 family protein n=1 Tax=Vibrio sp. WXL103 TaxID=3450710 RepID=UPI003EC796CC
METKVTLSELIATHELQDKLLSEAQTRGFITAMASAPYLLEVNEWLPFLWGGEEQAPFSDGAQLEEYIQLVINIWNETGPQLLEGTWQWPQACTLDEEDIVSEETREFCEGMLQGWQLCRDDWETLMPEDSEDNALLGGVLLSLSMLYDPLTSLTTLKEQGMEGLEQFEEIFNAIPVMICGLSQRGQALAQAQDD